MEHSISQLTLKEKELIDSLFRKNETALEKYAELLIWWNSKINLVSRDVSRETVLSHIKHSLCISLSKNFSDSQKIIDTGTGGGLPGIPLAICFPDIKIVANDIVTKKIFAVNDMINKLELNKSVNGIAGDVAKLDFTEIEAVITKHAFKLDQLWGLIEKKQWNRIVFLKGYQEAIEESKELEGRVKMSIIKLDSDFMPVFYKGKGVVEIERVPNE